MVSGEGTGAACVPKYSPGFNFWDGQGANSCGVASRQCVVLYQAGVGNNWRVKGKILCLDDDGKLVETWAEDINNACAALGDCGMSVNYVGKEGYNDIAELFKVIGEPGEEEEE